METKQSVLCVMRYRSLCRADPSPRGVPPSVVCIAVIRCNTLYTYNQ